MEALDTLQLFDEIIKHIATEVGAAYVAMNKWRTPVWSLFIKQDCTGVKLNCTQPISGPGPHSGPREKWLGLLEITEGCIYFYYSHYHYMMNESYPQMRKLIGKLEDPATFAKTITFLTGIASVDGVTGTTSQTFQKFPM